MLHRVPNAETNLSTKPITWIGWEWQQQSSGEITEAKDGREL